MNPHVKIVIVSEVMRGNGKTTICRLVTQYHALDGKFLAEVDPCAGNDKAGA